MEKKIRVCVVDDSPYIRKYFRENLGEDFSIVGESSDGINGLKDIMGKRPDIVLLDLMLPKMNGDAVAKAVMASNPTPILLMTSLSDSEIEKSFDILETSVVDVVKKPMELDGNFVKKIRHKLKVISNVKVYKLTGNTYPKVKTKNVKNSIFKVLLMGVSTGGPKLLRRILPELSRIENLALVIVQHIEKGFENGFVDWISSFTDKHACIIKENMLLENRIYLAPFDYNISVYITGDKIKFCMKDKTAEQIYHPSIDFAYEYFARTLGEKLICMQLSGMGYDGSAGASVAKSYGSRVFVQSPETAVAESMPRSVLSFADEIFTPENVFEKIMDEMD